MIDQATELRNLVLRATRHRQASSFPPPRQVIFAGGKGGVGATTMAVYTGLALSELGLRVVLVEADLYRAEVAMLCGLPERQSLADVLLGRCDIHEALVRGPAGLLVAPGLWAPGQSPAYGEAAWHRLFHQFAGLGRHADVLLLDTGSGNSDIRQRFWQLADEAVVVTTPDDVAVMDAYATIKILQRGASSGKPRLHLLVNQTRETDEAQEIYRRVHYSCQRFLGLELGLAGGVPFDPHLQRRQGSALPAAERAEESFGAVRKVAARLADGLAQPGVVRRAA